MGIQISNPVSQPAITYNSIHMTRMEISQTLFNDDTAQPKYEVTIYYRHYGVVDGVRYYKEEELQRVNLPDFLSTAITNAQAGDMTLINALNSIEVAIAGIIKDQTGAETSVV